MCDVRLIRTIHCKSFKVEKFHDIRGSIGNHKTFPVK